MCAILSDSGLSVLPLTLVAGAAALILASAPHGLGDGAPGPERPQQEGRSGSVTAASGNLVEMEVLGVVPLEGAQSSMLVLKDKHAETILPLVIGQSEALAIELRLRGAAAPRPLTHDLLDRAIAALGGRVVDIEIAALKDSVFEARIRLVQGSQSLVIDARPSDSVALALRSHAPIFARRKVLDDAGLTKAALDRLRQGRGADRAAPGTTL